MEPFIAQIVMFGGNFAPRGWAFCDGQLLAISTNQALFSILGTTYGGDGRTTFALPDLRGRYAMHPGTGPGLSPRQLGQRGGSETNTLTTQNMPAHNHAATVHASGNPADSANPDGARLGMAEAYSAQAASVDLAADAATTANTGGGTAVNNVPPYHCVNFIIALQGIFPSRS